MNPFTLVWNGEAKQAMVDKNRTARRNEVIKWKEKERNKKTLTKLSHF